MVKHDISTYGRPVQDVSRLKGRKGQLDRASVLFRPKTKVANNSNETFGLYPCTQVCKIISNRLRETSPAGRRTLRREIRIPIIHNFLQLSIKGAYFSAKVCLSVCDGQIVPVCV